MFRTQLIGLVFSGLAAATWAGAKEVRSDLLCDSRETLDRKYNGKTAFIIYEELKSVFVVRGSPRLPRGLVPLQREIVLEQEDDNRFAYRTVYKLGHDDFDIYVDYTEPCRGCTKTYLFAIHGHELPGGRSGRINITNFFFITGRCVPLPEIK